MNYYANSQGKFKRKPEKEYYFTVNSISLISDSKV